MWVTVRGIRTDWENSGENDKDQRQPMLNEFFL